MKNEGTLREEYLNARYEAKQEADIERMMREDINYALDKLGVSDIINEAEAVSIALKNYGHQMTVTKILKYVIEEL